LLYIFKKENKMANLRSLWIALTTAEVPLAGTDATLFLEFNASGKSFKLPDQPGNDLEMPNVNPAPPSMGSSNGTIYLFDVNNLTTEEFLPGTVVLRNDNMADLPVGPDIPNAPLMGWRCQSILIVAMGEDGKFYTLVAMPNVNRWLAADEPEGLSIVLDILKGTEIGLPN
jgi:hypothetical protein